VGEARRRPGARPAFAVCSLRLGRAKFLPSSGSFQIRERNDDGKLGLHRDRIIERHALNDLLRANVLNALHEFVGNRRRNSGVN